MIGGIDVFLPALPGEQIWDETMMAISTYRHSFGHTPNYIVMDEATYLALWFHLSKISKPPMSNSILIYSFQEIPLIFMPSYSRLFGKFEEGGKLPMNN